MVRIEIKGSLLMLFIVCEEKMYIE